MMHMPTNQIYIFVCITWINIVVHSNELSNTTTIILCAGGNPCNRDIHQTTNASVQKPVSAPSLSMDSSTNIIDLLQSVDVLIWIILALIATICCLCGSFICFCAFQHKFKQDMKAQTISHTSMDRQISPAMSSRSQHSSKWRSFSYDTSQKSEVALQPPSLHPSHSYSASPRGTTLHHVQQSMPKPTALSRSKSAENVTKSLSIRIDANHGKHKTYHSANSFAYGESASTGAASPRSFKARSASEVISNHTATDTNTGLTIPSLPVSRGSTGFDSPRSTEMTHITSHSHSFPVAVYNHTINDRSIVYNQQPPTPVSCTPVEITVTGPTPPSTMVLTPAHCSVPPPPPIKPLPPTPKRAVILPVASSTERIYHNLQHALYSLAEDGSMHHPTRLGPSDRTNCQSRDEHTWTDASCSAHARSVVPLKREVSNGIAGMLPGMFGRGDESSDDDMDASVESY